MFKIIIIILTAIMPCFLNVQQVHSAHIAGSGCSISNTGYLSDVAKEYERRKGVAVSIRGGGSLLGLHELTDGKVDFAASCRGKMDDDPDDIQFIQVAWDALVFIVHNSNLITTISKKDIVSIYNGIITNWQQLKGNDNPIMLFVSSPRKGLSGVEVSFSEMVMLGEKTNYPKGTVFLSSAGLVEQMVEKNQYSFGISGYSSARKRNVKMLMLDGVMPTKGNIANKTYPFKRPLYILTKKKPTKEVKDFVDFLLNKEGQRLISSLGIVSLSDAK